MSTVGRALSFKKSDLGNADYHTFKSTINNKGEMNKLENFVKSQT
jgi:hypothetical protein